MALLKRAHVRGINFGLMRRGLIAYPSEKISEEAADAVADELEDGEVPEVTDETGLTPEEASAVVNKLVEVANEISAKTGNARDLGVNKLAAEYSLEKAAELTATALIYKAAADPSDEGTIDARNNPSSNVIVPQGESTVDTTPGSVGTQMIQPKQPGAQADSPGNVIADVKLSSLLRKLSEAADGVLPPKETRVDLFTNADMGKDRIVTQGTTQQTPPAVPVPLKKNPAASNVTQQDKPKTDVQADVKQAAELLLKTAKGREILNQLEKEQRDRKSVV